MTVLSSDPDPIILLSGANYPLLTQFLCPAREYKKSGLFFLVSVTFQTFIVLSHEADRSNSPFFEKCKFLIAPECPVKTLHFA